MESRPRTPHFQAPGAGVQVKLLREEARPLAQAPGLQCPSVWSGLMSPNPPEDHRPPRALHVTSVHGESGRSLEPGDPWQGIVNAGRRLQRS